MFAASDPNLSDHQQQQAADQRQDEHAAADRVRTRAEYFSRLRITLAALELGQNPDGSTKLSGLFITYA